MPIYEVRTDITIEAESVDDAIRQLDGILNVGADAKYINEEAFEFVFHDAIELGEVEVGS